MQKHHKLRLITNTLDHEGIWCLSLISAWNMVSRSHRTRCHRHKATPWMVTELRGHVVKSPGMRHICQVAGAQTCVLNRRYPKPLGSGEESRRRWWFCRTCAGPCPEVRVPTAPPPRHQLWAVPATKERKRD